MPGRALITGLSGFLGTHLGRRLRDRGWEIAGTYWGSRAGLEDVRQEELEIEDWAGLKRFVASFRPEVVAHLAGSSRVGASWQDLAETFRVNLLGTEAVMRACAGAPVLFASSAEVYGQVEEAGQPIGEDAPLRPMNPYAMSKAAAERWVLDRGGACVRCFNVIGPGQAGQFAVPSFARQLARMAAGREERILRVGNLGARRDFVAVGDAVAALEILLEGVWDGVEPRVVNLASGRSRAISELVDGLIEASGLEVEIRVDPERLRPLDVPLVCGDASRLRALGWEPRVAIEAALAEVYEEALAAERAEST